MESNWIEDRKPTVDEIPNLTRTFVTIENEDIPRVVSSWDGLSIRYNWHRKDSSFAVVAWQPLPDPCPAPKVYKCPVCQTAMMHHIHCERHWWRCPLCEARTGSRGLESNARADVEALTRGGEA